MKVLQSCLSLSWGGMEMYTVTTALQLKKKNVEVTLLCYPGSKIHLEAKKKGIHAITSGANGYFHPVEIFKLSGYLKNENFDVIHTHASKDLWLLVPALRLSRLKTPLFLTKHVGSFIKKKDLFHRSLYKRVNTAFAISTVIKNNLLETTTLPEEKIKILHDGIDTRKFSPGNSNGEQIRKEFGINKDEILVGMIARFTWGKGHEEFLQAAEVLKKKYGNIKFMIVGEASRGEMEYEKKIKQLIISLNLEDKIILTGYREDVVDLLGAMDIFVFPSHSEAFGIALVEAMAVGVPSVCSDSNGILDIAVDGETSLFFKTKDAADLEKKLEKLIISGELRKNLGTQARERAVELFEIEKLTGKLLNFYQKSLFRE